MKVALLSRMKMDLSQKYSGVNNCNTRIYAHFNKLGVKIDEPDEDYKKHEVNKKNQGILDKADVVVGSEGPKEFIDYAKEQGKEIVEWEDFLIAIGDAGMDLKEAP